jgi:hypothetical protein
MGKTLRRRDGSLAATREWGASQEKIDRARNIWALRAQGLSYRAIAAKIGCSVTVVEKSIHFAEKEWGDAGESELALRQQLLEITRMATRHLVEDIEQQALNGQVTQQLDAQGNVTGATRKMSLNPQTCAELGRTLERAARLMGLLEQGPAEEHGGTTVTNIVLTSPSDGGSFEQWASAAASAPEPAAIEVSAAPASGA